MSDATQAFKDLHEGKTPRPKHRTVEEAHEALHVLDKRIQKVQIWDHCVSHARSKPPRHMYTAFIDALVKVDASTLDVLVERATLRYKDIQAMREKYRAECTNTCDCGRCKGVRQ